MPRRVRTHTNPLREFPTLAPPIWEDVFSDPELPFAIEFGSSKGEFLLEHARAIPGMNILGVEVRRPLVEELNAKILTANLKNASVVCGNIRGRFREFTPSGRFEAVYAFFPDPWPKKKHHKRRLIRAETLDELAGVMEMGAKIHVMTDHEMLRADIEEIFSASRDFARIDPIPLPTQSGWQEHCERTQRPYSIFCFERVG